MCGSKRMALGTWYGRNEHLGVHHNRGELLLILMNPIIPYYTYMYNMMVINNYIN